MYHFVVLGGSSVASPELFNALAARPERPALRVVLHGRDARKLEQVGQICAQVARTLDGAQVAWTTDLAEALDGADAVLNQIRVGGLSARSFDESFPHAFDIPGEETVGPGGFANAWRTVPVCLDYAREIEKRAPNARLINLTNPASIVQTALARATRVRVVSVCDSPVTLIENVARLLDVPPTELDVEYVGMLHFGFITGIKRDGADRMPRALEQMALLPGLVAHPGFLQAMGVVPSPYLNYFLAPELMLARQRAKGRTRASELQDLETQILDEYAAGHFSRLGKRAALWYDKIIVPVLLSLLGQAGDHIVNTRNGESIPFLPPETIVEVRGRVSPDGFLPYVTNGAPRDVQAMLQTNAAYEALVVEAILERSYDKAWRALRVNPLVRSAAQAREIVEVVLARESAER